MFSNASGGQRECEVQRKKLSNNNNNKEKIRTLFPCQKDLAYLLIVDT